VGRGCRERRDQGRGAARRIGPSRFDILRCAHAELLVTDLEASERFYVDLLG